MSDKLKICCGCNRPVVEKFGYVKRIKGVVTMYYCHICLSKKEHLK